MKKLLVLSTVLLATACVPATEKKAQTCDDACEENNTNTNNGQPVDRPDLKGSFIAGHLGNYWDCPEEGHGPQTPGEQGGASLGADLAPCESGDDSCNTPLNCDGAQLTIRLTNGGSEDALGLTIERIEIFDHDGSSLTTLPVRQVVRAEDNASFDGTLEAGGSIDLRVDYRGPVDLYNLRPVDGSGARSGGHDSALIEITVGADNHEDVVIDGGEVFVLPTVVT